MPFDSNEWAGSLNRQQRRYRPDVGEEWKTSQQLVEDLIERITGDILQGAPVPPRPADLPRRSFPPYQGRQHRPPHGERRMVAPDNPPPIHSNAIAKALQQPVRRSTAKERRGWKWWKDDRGSIAVEAALIFPLAITAGLGFLDVGRLQWVQARLQSIAEEAAGGWARGALTDASAASTWANQRAAALGYSVTFSASTASCGHDVAGSYPWQPYGYEMSATTVSVEGCAP